MKRFASRFLLMLLCSVLASLLEIDTAKAGGTIYIRADGSVEGTTYISTVDNVTYTFTANIYDSVFVEGDNVVVDGVGYTLQGTAVGAGIDLSGSNVTIRNVRIRSFYSGILLWHSSNSSIFGNTIGNNRYGIRLYRSSRNSISMNNIANNEWGGIDLWRSSNNNSISGNNMRNNGIGIYLHYSSGNTISGSDIANNQYGIFLYRSSKNNIHHNNFTDNPQQVNIRSSTSVWDDDAGRGNYWSDYEEKYRNATEIDDSGIWDTPYIIDEDNQDNYPIVPEHPTWPSIIFTLIVLTVTIAVYKRRLIKMPIQQNNNLACKCARAVWD